MRFSHYIILSRCIKFSPCIKSKKISQNQPFLDSMRALWRNATFSQICRECLWVFEVYRCSFFSTFAHTLSTISWCNEKLLGVKNSHKFKGRNSQKFEGRNSIRFGGRNSPKCADSCRYSHTLELLRNSGADILTKSHWKW